MILQERLDEELNQKVKDFHGLGKQISAKKGEQISFRLGYHQALADLQHLVRLFPVTSNRVDVEDFVHKYLYKIKNEWY